MSKLIRCSEDDPHRCKGPSQVLGRCPFLAIQNEQTLEWTEYCPRHGANSQIQQQNIVVRQLYDFNKWSQRVSRFQKHNESKSITAELAVLRLLLEQKMNMYSTESELVMASGSISDLVIKIEKLVKSVSSLDKQSGLLMDKDQVRKLADKFVDIVCDYIQDGELIERIILDFQKALEDAGRPIPTTNPDGSPEEVDNDLL